MLPWLIAAAKLLWIKAAAKLTRMEKKEKKKLADRSGWRSPPPPAAGPIPFEVQMKWD